MRNKLLLVLSVSFLILLFFLLRNNQDAGKELAIKGTSFIEGLRVVHKKDGNSMWTLTAKRADIKEDDDTAKLTDVIMRIESKDMTISAPGGLYNLEKRDLALNGKITAVTKDYTIVTSSVQYNNSTGEIKTSDSVRLQSNKFNVEGEGMQADSEQKVRVLKNVKATFYR